MTASSGSRRDDAPPPDSVPEADALDQQREAVPGAALRPDDDEAARRPLDYPDRIPFEAPEADVLEQSQAVDTDDDRWG
jgi:hypothetical protein